MAILLDFVFALNVVEFFSDLLLFWFPDYWLAKSLFVVWLFLPLSYNGSEVLYSPVVRPAFIKCQGEIEAAKNTVKGKLRKLADQVQDLVYDGFDD